MRNKIVFDELRKLGDNQKTLLNILSNNISLLVEEIRSPNKGQRLNINSEFISLPNCLQQTVIALKKIGGSGTATQVSLLTLRARAQESLCLNRLTELNWVSKRKRSNGIGRPLVVFSLEKKLQG